MTAIILVIDRIFISNISSLKLSIAELIIGITVLSIYLLDNKTIILELEDYKHEYFVLILNDTEIKTSELNYSFPFNKSLVADGKHAVVDAELKNSYRIKIDNPKIWGGHSINTSLNFDINI